MVIQSGCLFENSLLKRSKLQDIKKIFYPNVYCWIVLTGTLLIVLAALILTISWTRFYTVHYYAISCVVAGSIMTASFLCTLSQFSENWEKDLSPAVCFCYFLIAVLLLYTVLPLNFHTTVILACGYSVAFETLISIATPERVKDLNHVIVNVLLHLCLHAIGVHIKITIEVSD